MRFVQSLLLTVCLCGYLNAFSLSLRRVKKEETARLFDMKFYKELLAFSQVSNAQKGLTCFTCDKTGSNDECNKNAVDEPCVSVNSTETVAKFSCMTVHTYNRLAKKTISVEKKCALDCAPQTVGCTKNPRALHEITCTYCCNQNYCNMDAAKSTEQALILAESLFTSNVSSHYNASFMLMFILFVFLLYV